MCPKFATRSEKAAPTPGSRDYGVNHSEVIVTLDTLLPQNQTYTLTITDVADETDPNNTIDPNPTDASSAG